MNKHTLSVHAGQQRETSPGVVNPLDLSTAYEYFDAGEQLYPRYFNTSNQRAIVEKLSQLEKAETGLIFSSGMAAISTTLMALLRRGDHAVMLSGLYGGTHSFVIQEFDDAGIDYTFADGQPDQLMAAINDRTRLIFLETPTNPLLSIVDLAAVAGAAREKGVLTLLDNTFASPINQNPIDFGIDLVLHSGTKYLGGHSDLSFGAVLGSQSLVDKVYKKAVNYGGNLNGLSCYLVERSLKTLAVRVQQQNRNARQIAESLVNHDMISQVNYPGLPQAPGHDVAARQMEGFGGMLSFVVAGTRPVTDLLRKFELISPAMSLGGVETTATLPVFTSHRKMPQAQREALGISDRLVRLSVGIEDTADLVNDLQQALQAFSRNPALA